MKDCLLTTDDDGLEAFNFAEAAGILGSDGFADIKGAADDILGSDGFFTDTKGTGGGFIIERVAVESAIVAVDTFALERFFVVTVAIDNGLAFSLLEDVTLAAAPDTVESELGLLDIFSPVVVSFDNSNRFGRLLMSDCAFDGAR